MTAWYIQGQAYLYPGWLKSSKPGLYAIQSIRELRVFFYNSESNNLERGANEIIVVDDKADRVLGLGLIVIPY